MTTTEKIDVIIENQYGGFSGRKMEKLGTVYKKLRERIGDEKYLAFIEAQQLINPRPVYKIPENILNHE